MKRILTLTFASVLVLSLYGQGQLIDKRDGNSYRIADFAGMTWMTENLRYNIPGSSSFDNNPNNIQSYGLLYDWKTAVKSCPEEWHLPSGEEFRALVNNIENDKFWTKNNSDPKYFNVQLAGMQDYEGTFTEMDESAYLWTSTEYDDKEAEFFIYMNLKGKPIIDVSRRQDMPDIHGAEKSNKYSVRCVKNK